MITLGCCCILAAAALSAYNHWDTQRAAEESQRLTSSLENMLAAGGIANADLVAQVDKNIDAADEDLDAMAALSISGYDVCGVVSMPAINVELAVIRDWSYPNLTASACRYSGTPDGQMILLAHNYHGHFGDIEDLVPGDEVTFTDVEGTVYTYQVAGTEIWATNQLREIISGDTWDLTMFTCTYSGNHRTVVRCVRTATT